MTDHKLSEVSYELCPEDGAHWHDAANIFPWIEGKDRETFVEDIERNGVLEPIVFYQGAILDGRNRYMAARQFGQRYPRCDYLGNDPTGFVIARNLNRRHLNESQRAMAAGRLAKLPKGANQHSSIDGPSQGEAATILRVSPKSVERAKIVQRDGAPELVEAVDKGTVSVSAAKEIASLPIDDQVAVIRNADPKAFTKVAKEVRAGKQTAKKERRAVRERQLASKIAALPEKRYGVIYADPEWHDEQYSDETGMDRHASNHYPTNPSNIIASRPVVQIAAEDCVLFLWTTNQHLAQALTVLSEWGFEYASNYVWRKPSIGLGRWNRSRHEILLIGARGNPVAPAPGEQWESVIDAPRGEHSAKPDKFAAMIEAYYPNLPKIELNRRGPARNGWDAWGLEAD